MPISEEYDSVDPKISHGAWKALEQKSVIIWTTHWLACGGTEAELALMHAQRELYCRMYSEGPIGWGPVPEGCTEATDAKLGRNQGFEKFQRVVNRTIYAASGPVRTRRVDLSFQSPLLVGNLPEFLPSLWALETELVPATTGPLWWSREYAPSLYMLWGDLLNYCWILGTAGGQRIPLADRCLAACASGRLPVAEEDGIVIAYRVTPELMQTQVKKEKRRRDKHDLPPEAPPA
jgi:hypothetical protein